MQQDYDSSVSGYIVDSFEGISQVFTDVEIISTSDTNIVARAKRYGRWWLLKGLNKNVANETGYQQRLRKELELLMQLQHPNVVTSIGLEQIDSIGNCIVMEYVEGITLKEWLLHEHTRKEHRRIAMQIIETVGYIHSKGIVHRDLKPENIIITTNGDHVKLIDFGLADTDSHTILKQAAGTQKYMSPEQMYTAQADVRNDIYSLGVIFSQMSLDYNYILKRCRKPIEQRYKNIYELKKDISIHETRKKWYIGVLAIVTIFLTIGLFLIQTNRIREREESSAIQMDSLHHLVGSLKDSITIMRTAEQTRIDYKKQVEKALWNGKTKIDKALGRSASDLKNLRNWDFDTQMEIQKKMVSYGNLALESYKKELYGILEENETQNILLQLEIYKSEQQLKWTEKINQEFKRHQRTSASK